LFSVCDRSYPIKPNALVLSRRKAGFMLLLFLRRNICFYSKKGS
jgi:hypothetical protein